MSGSSSAFDLALMLEISLKDQKPLTLALSQRERGLTVVNARDTLTSDTESNAGFETNQNRLPVLGGEDCGSHTTNPKPTTRF